MKKIHQVLVILLDNALKYTNPEDKIILDSSVNHKEWLIHVKNTGPSISEEDQARIFDRFYREDQSRAKETGGYGLGSNCKTGNRTASWTDFCIQLSSTRSRF